ncbi:expansin family [Pyrrhoderma noxium]|uniref:Expansin family n=1 Tax=Pyrrhoderma noxium TaxID=2282107 RepID=A0A286U8T1_9AGAM|nr:expansin family [Pyrrhoderma noxium]
MKSIPSLYLVPSLLPFFSSFFFLGTARAGSTDVPADLNTGTSKFTYYNVSVGLGACGLLNNEEDYTVALNEAQFGSGYPGPHCYEKIKISYGGKETTAVIMDKCPGCPSEGLDLSPGLFGFFQDLGTGVIHGSWSLTGEKWKEGETLPGPNNPQSSDSSSSSNSTSSSSTDSGSSSTAASTSTSTSGTSPSSTSTSSSSSSSDSSPGSTSATETSSTAETTTSGASASDTNTASTTDTTDTASTANTTDTMSSTSLSSTTTTALSAATLTGSNSCTCS